MFSSGISNSNIYYDQCEVMGFCLATIPILLYNLLINIIGFKERKLPGTITQSSHNDGGRQWWVLSVMVSSVKAEIWVTALKKKVRIIIVVLGLMFSDSVSCVARTALKPGRQTRLPQMKSVYFCLLSAD